MNNMLIMAYDGDNAGRLVGRAILADDINALGEVSNRITNGHEIVRAWVEQNGGSVISGGGDEGTFQIPAEALNNVEQLRADYQFATNLTMTVGVGSTLSQAGKSLMVGKFRGKNMVVQYDPSVDQELQAAADRVDAGQGTEEEKKISEAYLQAPAAPAAPAIGAHNELDCKYCQESAGHEHSAENCEYCAEHEAKVAQGAHEDNCQYCQHHDTNNAAATQMATMIDTDSPGTQTERGAVDSIDNTNAPVSGDMVDGVSRPAGYNPDSSPAAMDLSDDQTAEPNLAEVLRGGLDQHADQIGKEKVAQMIGQALEGFKASKGILEKAKEQAPQFYQASIAMLKAMLEMGKMLGMGPQEAPAEQPQPAPQAQPAAGQGAAAGAPQQ